MERDLRTVGYAESAPVPRDKSQTEIIAERLRETMSRMADYNSSTSNALDRLCGGHPKEGVTATAAPMPTDFISAANAMLDEIGRELNRMESNCQRLSRVA